MNLLDLDVSGLDVPAFLTGARSLFLLGAMVWLTLLVLVKRPPWLVAFAIAANAYVWAVTNFPLQRLYGLGVSPDRVNNIGLCQVVAAGNSPLRTAQVGQLHFEPFWGLLVAVMSGWDPDRVLSLYPFLPLLMAAAFTVSLYLGLRVPGSGDRWPAWERAVVAAFATLLCSSPMDFAGTYRVPWVMTFLLKPNHALGLVLFPLVLRAFASIRGWGGRVGTGLLLHVLGWVFVLHMVYVAAGLVVFAGLSLLARREESRRDVTDVAVVLLVNLLVVSPYLYMLFIGYPFLTPSPVMTIPPWSPHLLETTVRSGWLFALGVWGAVVAHRKGDRLGRLWAAQVLSAFLIWGGYLLLSALWMARERDEIFYWVRFLSAASAGIGVWDLATRVAPRLRGLPSGPAWRAAGVMLLVLPWSLPYWWDPVRMDSYFSGSIAPLSSMITVPTEFLRHQTEPDAVVAGDRDFARYVAALGARRVLLASNYHFPPDAGERIRVEGILMREDDGRAVAAAAEPYRIRYLVVTPRLLTAFPEVTLEQLQARRHFKTVHLTRDGAQDFVAILRIEPGRQRLRAAPARLSPRGEGT